jgi:phenylpyruvate tautomerase PptA (4-oxalocrotonate tautomerase family)
MPKIYISSPLSTFAPENRAKIATALTDLGIRCERLAARDTIRRGIWVYFSETPADCVFSAGEISPIPLISLHAYTLEGGMNHEARTIFIGGATEVLRQNVERVAGEATVYVAIHEIPESGWGMNGRHVALSDLRKDQDAPAQG